MEVDPNSVEVLLEHSSTYFRGGSDLNPWLKEYSEEVVVVADLVVFECFD